MRCANRNCNVVADDLLKGTLKLMELETDPSHRLLHAAGGFPICIARTRYFWLCDRCSRKFTISRWNSSGVFLARRPGSVSPSLRAPERKPSSPDHTHNRRDRVYGTA